MTPRQSTDAVSEALAGEGYLADRAPGDGLLPRCALEQPLLLEGEAGVGKTEVAQGARRGHGRAADPAAVPRGHRRPPRALRLGLRRASCSRIRAAEAGGDERRALLAALPAAPAAAGGARARRAGRAADRRDRPRRRRVRGVPARVPVGLPGHDPRARDDHAPRARPLVMLTSNRTRELHDALKRRCLYHWIDYPTPRARARDRPRPAARRRRARSPRACARRSRAARRGALQAARRGGDDRLGAGAAGARRPRGSTTTLGAALKVHEDVERVRERGVLDGA